ncbi:hypothetical protein F3J44_00370 [Pantoea sp. Tr-811]|uniref:DUF3322 domain-containing protein n=1 Tax=Pantoea sp. Tr-811 TaxID=2608361 RepID=UPI00142201EE|nr:DUF3322 domain-containing protein [Pantoea sp. Tr-811]NIF24824.1 hypothetical protein [Pantoea sp. Tr-811]
MKSPLELGHKLARQWQQSSTRVARLLNPGSWPQRLSIGKPSAGVFAQSPQRVLQHVQRWREVKVGTVEWARVSYRAGLEPVSIPLRWQLRNPSEWVAAIGDAQVSHEYARLEYLVAHADSTFHSLLVAQRSLWMAKPCEEVVATLRLAMQLSPGCASGRPLRLLAEHGVDTKFFERHSALLSRLLDERFEGAVSEQGLTTFLDALEESSHWVLVVPLEPGLLPFRRLRLTTAELAQTPLPGTRILVVENEQCLHLLPEVPGTVAILGAGLDVQWLGAAHFADKCIGYWGDLDSWGLLMLARARLSRPGIEALLMHKAVFEQHGALNAVIEPVRAQATTPDGLLEDEGAFYQFLLQQTRGRLEQEYLPKGEVAFAISEWAGHQGRS